jgi:hypothetical protein
MSHPGLKLTRRTCIIGMTCACAAGLRAQAAERAGAVESLRGECYALADTSRRTLQTASAVFVGDTVATEAQSALGLRLGAATQINLGPEARLRIDRFLMDAGGVLSLDSGALLFDHDSQAGMDQTAVRSPFGLIAVRGTRFFAGPSAGVFGVFVERGVVTVVGGNTAVSLSGGLGTNIASPGARPTDPAPWGAARIASALASVR